MCIAVLEGRPFETADHLSPLGNVVVSRSAAEALWPGQPAVGRRLQQHGAKDWHTVIGVVEDVMQDGFRDTPQALVYFPLVGPHRSWCFRRPRTSSRPRAPRTIAPEVRALVREVAPEAPMYRVVHDGAAGRGLDDPARRSRYSRSVSCRRSPSSSAP